MENHYRHEYKFMISRSTAQLLKLRLRGIMQPDPHAGPDGQYTIRSLYFDDVHHTAFRDKVDGVDERIKFRIRCYNFNSSVLKLECKEKKGHLTRKTGQTITVKDALALQHRDLAGCPDNPQGLTARLRLLCSSTGLRPMVLVDYDRTPFICHAGNTRITLDENLRTKPYCTDLFAATQGLTPVLEPDQVILEVKFDDFLPGHLSAALSDIPKAPMALSKFAMCLNLT